MLPKDIRHLPPLSSPMRHVAAIVLNYNSDADLRISVPQLCAQEGTCQTVIIVDNASNFECVLRVKAWLREEYPQVVIGSAAEVHAWVRAHPEQARAPGSVYLILNPENSGYSAGNNIGARLAVGLGCAAVLIVNPDVRITDPHYVDRLAEKLLTDERCAVAASAMLNLAGANENPMYEAGFLEELFWPCWGILSRIGFRPPSQRARSRGRVEKVSGSCLLVRSTFLETIGYFDEGVFLYCEEAILGTQIRNAGQTIGYVPELKALHAHVSSAKGNPTRRVRQWIQSRRYYHKHYARYGPLRRFLLRLSQGAMLGLAYVRRLFLARG